MLIGIISDSHDNLPKISAAVEFFNSKSISALIHCGDFVAPFALLPFKELNCSELYSVFGNNDGERVGLKTVASDNGWKLFDGPCKIELGGKNIGMMHEPDSLESLASKGECDIVAYGHLHKPLIEKRGEVLLINPGESCGWVTGKATVATVNLETMKSSLHVI